MDGCAGLEEGGRSSQGEDRRGDGAVSCKGMGCEGEFVVFFLEKGVALLAWFGCFALVWLLRWYCFGFLIRSTRRCFYSVGCWFLHSTW